MFHVQIENIQLIRDTETGRSKGYGFITVSIILAVFPNFFAAKKETVIPCFLYARLYIAQDVSPGSWVMACYNVVVKLAVNDGF